MTFKHLFKKPCIISVIGDVNAGKSQLLYNILEELNFSFNFNVYTYGLRLRFNNATQVYSVAEIEQISNSLIIIDELSSLFDLDNRKVKKQIENTLRLLNHNNNIIVLCGTPENFKKFLAAKVDIMMFKKTTFSDCINGCKVKNILNAYKGNERGSEVLNIKINEVLLFDGQHYTMHNVDYLPKYDSKKNNVNIFQPIVKKKVVKKINKN